MEPTRHSLAFTVWPLPCQYLLPPSPHSFPPQANFYAQYKSIKPYLMKKEKSKTCVCGISVIGKHRSLGLLCRLTDPPCPSPPTVAPSTTRARRAATSWTACTSVSCAPAAQPAAPRTGGTATSTSVPLYCSRRTAGSSTAGKSYFRHGHVHTATSTRVSDRFSVTMSDPC